MRMIQKRGIGERKKGGNAEEEWALFKLGAAQKSGGTLVAFPHPEALFYCVMARHYLWLS
jgi:hypothetical protein